MEISSTPTEVHFHPKTAESKKRDFRITTSQNLEIDICEPWHKQITPRRPVSLRTRYPPAFKTKILIRTYEDSIDEKSN